MSNETLFKYKGHDRVKLYIPVLMHIFGGWANGSDLVGKQIPNTLNYGIG